MPPGLFWANTLVSGLAIAFACWGIFQASLAERETRMLEYYVLEVDGKLLKSGVIDTGYETWKREHQK